MKSFYGQAVKSVFKLEADIPTAALPTITTARIYSEEPSDTNRTEASNTSSSMVEEVTSWTKVDSGIYHINFAAITDADPFSGDEFENYYVTVRFQYDAGAPVVFAENVIRIYRPNAWSTKIDVRPSDLVAREKKFLKVLRSEDLDLFIDEAIKEVTEQLRTTGIEFTKVLQLDELNLLMTFKACELVCWNLYGDAAPFWRDKAINYRERYDSFFGSLKISYDADGDGIIDPVEESRGGGFVTLYK